MGISLDVEGTLADIHSVWIEHYNKLNGANLTLEDLTDYYFESTPFHTTEEEFLEQTAVLWQDEWKQIPPTEKRLREKIEPLSKYYEIDIITHRNMPEQIKKWLRKHKIPFHKFFIVDDKSKLDYDVFIDDDPTIVQKLKSKGKQLILYQRPYNTEVKGWNIYRIRNFKELQELL